MIIIALFSQEFTNLCHAMTLVPLENRLSLLIKLVVFYQAKGKPDISVVIKRLSLTYVCNRFFHLCPTADILIDQS